MKRLVLITYISGLTYLCFCPATGQAQQNTEQGFITKFGRLKPAVVRQETGDSRAEAKKVLKSVKPNKTDKIPSRSPTIQFAEVEIAVNEQFSYEYINSLPTAPASSMELLSDSNSLRVQLPAGQVKALVDEGADVTVLRKFLLVEGHKDQAGALQDAAMPLESCSGTYAYGENDDDVDIPDDGSGWAYSDIYISTAPPGATVICVDVHYEIIHTYVEDLVVDLTNEDFSKEYRLWENEGDGADYINETVTGITIFNGELVNQIWTLWALDTFPFFDSGYIDYWWIKVYYEEMEGLFIQPDSYFENTAEISFSFSSYPGTVCFSASDDCGSFDPVCDSPVFEDGSWWVSTQYTPCEDECISVTITAEPTSGSDQTKIIHLDERLHIGCCLPVGLGGATYDPETNEPAQAQVTVSVIPEEGGTVEPSSGLSQWDPEYGLYLFWSTYTPDCDYTGRVRVRFQTNNDTLIYSFDQNPVLNCSPRFQTISESFCTEGWHINNIQIYKMYLCSNASYDFSLCDSDGLGAFCDGDGDLEIFDSSCVSQWYIDGDPECDYDASTLGTDYEDWSPPSDGYYYLIVSEYYGEPMSYSLAYRGGTAGDFEPDCDVDFADFAVLAGQWLQPPGTPSADIAPEAADNFVDILDLAAFTGNWLEGTLP